MNKKLMSAVLAATMLISAAAQAANLADYFSTVPGSDTILNNSVIKTNIETKVKKSGDTEYQLHASNGAALLGSSSEKVFDYETTLNMTNVKEQFTFAKSVIAGMIEGNADQSQVDNSTVQGSFTVKIAYDNDLEPASAIAKDDVVLKQGSDVFEVTEVKDKTETAPAEVTFKVKDGVTISALEAEDYKSLDNLSVELKNFTAKADDKYINVTVTMEGKTEFYDATDATEAKKYGEIKYVNDPENANNTAVVFVKTRTGGSGGLGGNGTIAPKAYTVIDGKNTAVDVVTVNGVSKVDVAAIEAPEQEGYKFDGWYLDKELTKPAADTITITETTYLYPKFTPIGEVNVYTVIDGVETKQELTEEEGKKYFDVSSLTAPEKTGFAFEGWYFDRYYTKPAEGKLEITEDTYLYPHFINIVAPSELESEEHIAYIMGYPDDTVKPNNNITREEVAAAFYRLMKADYRAQYETTENNFADVDSDRWSNASISTLAKAGIIVGDTEGNLNPAKPITRAEFAAIASKFALQATVGSDIFSDISGHWAEDSILKVVSAGWITGYEDGTFKPNANITRAEAMTIINKMLVRYADHDTEFAKNWSDVDKADWYYDAVIEATTYNKYERDANGWKETWTGINE